MAVGVKYTTISRVERAAVYTCVRCAYTSPVTVIGVGNASANASNLQGNHEAATARSRTAAAINAEGDVPRMLGLVRCPSCGERDPAWVRRFYRQHVSMAIVIAVAIAIAAVLVFGRGGLTPIVVSWAIMTAVGLGVYYFAADPSFEWNRAALCVRFPKTD